MAIVIATTSAAAVTTPCVSTCTPWATAADLCEPYTEIADGALVVDCLQAASDILYQLVGRQFPGVCQDTVRPAAGPMGARPSWWPRGASYPTGHGYCGGGCGLRVPAVTLGAYPVDGVVQVLLDGVEITVSDDEMVLVDDRWLLRVADADGHHRTWPTCQRLDRPSTEEHTFEVTFNYGVMPPAAGARAAAVLGGELALSCAGSDCRLPKRVTALTRQGVTETVVLDPMSFLDEGKTGLYECDAFLRAFNPAGVSRAAALFMPGRPRTVRRRSA